MFQLLLSHLQAIYNVSRLYCLQSSWDPISRSTHLDLSWHIVYGMKMAQLELKHVAILTLF
jgi:hypothetical protein